MLATAPAQASEAKHYLFWAIPEEPVDRTWRVGADHCPAPLTLELARLNRLQIFNDSEHEIAQPLPASTQASLAILAVEIGGMRLEVDALGDIVIHPGGSITVEAVPTSTGRWPVDCAPDRSAVEILAVRGARPPRPLAQAIPAGILPVAKRVPAFTLTDHQGRRLTQRALMNRWSLLFFGYTSCPDVCPGTIVKASAAIEALDARAGGTGTPLSILFVSVDPERDTPEVLAGYVRHFGPSLIAATASHNELGALTDALGAGYRAGQRKDDFYAVSHTADLFLIAPDGRVVGRFAHDTSLDELVRAIAFAVDHFPR